MDKKKFIGKKVKLVLLINNGTRTLTFNDALIKDISETSVDFIDSYNGKYVSMNNIIIQQVIV